MGKGLPRRLKAEDAVNHWLDAGHANGPRDVLQPDAISHRDIPEGRVAPLQLEEVDAGVVDAQEANRGDLASLCDGLEGGPDRSRSANMRQIGPFVRGLVGE